VCVFVCVCVCVFVHDKKTEKQNNALKEDFNLLLCLRE